MIYRIKKEFYFELCKKCGSKENVIKYINETFRLAKKITDIVTY